MLRGAARTGTRASLLAMALGLTATVVASPPLHRKDSTSAKPVGKPAGRHSWFQIGRASWYGGHFNGRKTANGERYNMNDLTCAHPSLPLGSWVRVTNLYNQKIAFVRVNDRGPVNHGLIIDLSYAAAQKLGFSGTGKVKVESVDPANPEIAEELMASLPPLAEAGIIAR